MRTGWAGLVLLGLGGCGLYAPVDADFNADVDVNAPQDGRDAGAAPDRPVGDDKPRPGVNVAEPEPDAGSLVDAGPPALFDMACADEDTCLAAAPEGTIGDCWLQHTDPTRFHDMYYRCTFACGRTVTIHESTGTSMEWRASIEMERACWAIGGKCGPLHGDDRPETYCVPPGE